MRSDNASNSGSSEVTRQDSQAFIRALVDQLIDVMLGGDIDTSGRLVQEEHLRMSLEPSGEQNFLLIASRKGHNVLPYG